VRVGGRARGIPMYQTRWCPRKADKKVGDSKSVAFSLASPGHAARGAPPMTGARTSRSPRRRSWRAASRRAAARGGRRRSQPGAALVRTVVSAVSSEPSGAIWRWRVQARGSARSTTVKPTTSGACYAPPGRRPAIGLPRSRSRPGRRVHLEEDLSRASGARRRSGIAKKNAVTRVTRVFLLLVLSTSHLQRPPSRSRTSCLNECHPVTTKTAEGNGKSYQQLRSGAAVTGSDRRGAAAPPIS
jgi:hypothetical protein